MTTLYRHVEIISAEQAEALPDGTIITHAENYPQEKFAGLWGREGNSSESLAEEEGWTALVPIEAEEVRVVASGGLERDQHGATVINHTPDGPRRDYRRTEFHTPWEVAP